MTDPGRKRRDKDGEGGLGEGPYKYCIVIAMMSRSRRFVSTEFQGPVNFLRDRPT